MQPVTVADPHRAVQCPAAIGVGAHLRLGQLGNDGIAGRIDGDVSRLQAHPNATIGRLQLERLLADVDGGEDVAGFRVQADDSCAVHLTHPDRTEPGGDLPRAELHGHVERCGCGASGRGVAATCASHGEGAADEAVAAEGTIQRDARGDVVAGGRSLGGGCQPTVGLGGDRVEVIDGGILLRRCLDVLHVRHTGRHLSERIDERGDAGRRAVVLGQRIQPSDELIACRLDVVAPAGGRVPSRDRAGGLG